MPNLRAWLHPEGDQLRRDQQLGWALGSLGTAVMLGTLTGYGLYFMTTYLGIGALLAGQLIGLSKFYDMLTDPIMGHLSDRTQSRWGRRRPYLLLGAIACPVSLALLFQIPAAESTSATVIYIAAVLVLYATAFTIFNVPYLAMPAEITTSYRERTVIMSQRIFFSTIGVLTVSVLGPNLIKTFGGGVAGYMSMSWVMSAICLTAMCATFWLTRNTAVLPPSPAKDRNLVSQLRFIWQNRPFRFYMLAKICMFTAQSSVQGTLLFFGSYVLDRGEMILAAFGVGYTAGSLVSIPLWNFLITRLISKRAAFMISSLGLGSVFLTWLAAEAGEAEVLLYGRFLLLGVFSAGSMISASAMLPDIMDYDRRRSGINQEGLYAAAFSLVEKIANTVGPIVIGTLLGLTGFVSTRGGEIVAQPEAAIAAIRVGVSIVPFLLAGLAAWLIRHYELDEQRLAETRSETDRASQIV